MFDDLKDYLMTTRLVIENSDIGDVSIDDLMGEISIIAIDNWSTRTDNLPDLNKEQLNKAMTRAIAKSYSKN